MPANDISVQALKDVPEVDGQVPKGVAVVNFNALHTGGLTPKFTGGHAKHGRPCATPS